ncbi:AAA family ATPase [Bradyrhizobium jicamae]|uniref:AAA family ATPase n=1 Tax=Bradyrhizobium jicamae TaxID=280332 RepID=A0ABS5FXR7_9BRAD|nr:adenylate/guanylate cyclase domain-containing protein [Bradyrhizobium jicamae]MBR0801563.1 AAA family ATPase [Bradyrhizobium jicamae]
MDVESWLRRLGLDQYEAAFRENEIDETILSKLTAEDLKDLGVSIVGHRRKLLEAIAALGADGARKPSSVDEASTPSRSRLGTEDRAERRQVTVMFSDLVGSTALSGRMDPEDLREVISAYQRCVAETVRRFGGFVAKYMGDGVLIYFGYPQAHEDDAERAVRAGLELVAAVSRLNSHAPLQTRVGAATGLVVVGDLIGSGASQEQTIVGETPNLAARLQGVAEPDSVVIADSTRRLIGNLFELADLGTQDLKGIVEPVRAWAAVRPSSVESRFEALHASGMTALVGRKQETDLLLRCWSNAKAGKGQLVLLSGEAGIGKSRLTAALLDRLTSEPHTRLRYFCSPQRTDSALYPIIGQLERAAGLQREDTLPAKLDKLDALLALTSTSREDVPLLAEMLSLPNDGRYPTLDLTPEQRRERTLEALTSQLTRLASQRPVLMIFEDAHWIDPTSLETLTRQIREIKAVPALLIVTSRPEFAAPWVRQSQVTSIVLNRLGERDAATIVASLAGEKELPADVLAEIVDRTDGVPLFVEEMTKAVLEAQSEGDARKTAAAVPSTAAVPASLHASLMARLDRLGPAKEIAQIGAVIGREFSYALLAAVVSEPEAELLSTLERLTAAGLLLQQGEPPGATYLFKHALIQDAAYGTLLRGPRRTLHARIAETFENQFADIAETQPELVARHCTEAGLIEKAAGLWGTAGRRSVERSALLEAAEQLTRAIAQIKTLPATPALRREAIKLQVAFATVLFHVRGYTAPETIAAFERADAMIEEAEALGERSEDVLLRFSVLYGQWTGNFTSGNLERAAAIAKHFLAVAERQQLSAALVMAHRVMGGSYLFFGELQTAKSHLDRAIALYRPTEHRALATRFGQDIGVAALAYRAYALCRLGYPERALADTEHAFHSAQDLGQTGTLAYALLEESWVNFLCGRFVVAEARAQELSALSQKHRLSYWGTWGRLFLGWVFAVTGRGDEAVELISSSLSGFASARTTLFSQSSLIWLARAHASCGRFADAEDTISRAVSSIEETNERLDEAEILRTAGEIARMGPLPDAVKAEAYFNRALAVACQQQARSWELRAAMSMARLWRDQAKPQRALELLAPVYGWFTEGFELPDLMEAKALLNELR